MSSTHGPFVATNCIDDDEATTMCHTQEQATPWISVQLPPSSPVSQIIIYNRHDGNFDRLSPFQLWVGASPGDYNSATSAACGIHDLTAPAIRGPFAFDCTIGNGSPLTGEYVTLVLPGSSRIINLMGIHAYVLAASPPPLPPVTPGGSVQSIVEANFTLGGDVASFDQHAFRTNLAASLDGVSADNITLTVEGASIIVFAQIVTRTEIEAETTFQTLKTMPIGALSTSLSVAVEAVSGVQVKSVALAAPVPPPPFPPAVPPAVPPSPPPSTPPPPPLPAAPIENLSNGQPATSSSRYSSSTVASRAVDGDFSIAHPNLFHSGRSSILQWWSVRLTCQTINPSITIYARDCCHSTSTYEVDIYLNANSYTDGPANAGSACAEITDLYDSTVRTAVCSGTGNMLVIRSQQSGKYMHFGEVVVMGSCAYSPPPALSG